MFGQRQTELMMFGRFRHFLGLTALIAFLAPALAAGDPPARVGRLALVDGGVTLRADRQDPGTPAVANWPLSSGAIIDTERRGRAEAWVGSTAYRLAGNSRAEFVTIDDRSVDLQLATGTLAVTIRDREQADDLEIETPEGRVRFADAGRYRIEARPGLTTVAAQSGSAEVFADGRPLAVRAGEMASIDGRGVVTIDAAPYGDDFDNWVSAQDNRAKAAYARRNVSPYMTGYQDLDNYGDWGTAEDYGNVWYPRAVAADWAPYRDGRWAWIEPWGWTWVDAAPWGFAPFHYGRWVQIGGRWGWAPGAYSARPVYAPALVGWYGNPGWSVNFRYGAAPAVGWFPLAPREVYVPAYRASPNYVRQMNVTHVHNVREIERATRPDYRPEYRHGGQPQAVTVVPADRMREGKPIKGNALRPRDMQEIGQAPMASRAPSRNWLPPAGDARPGPRNEPDGRVPRQEMPPAAGRQREPGDYQRGAPEPQRGMSAYPNRPPDGGGRQGLERQPPMNPRHDDNRAFGAPQVDERAMRMEQREYRQAPAAVQAPPRPEPRPEPRYQAPPMREFQQPAQQPRDNRPAYREAPHERPAPMVREAPRQMQAPPMPAAQPREMPRSEPRPPPGDGQRGGNPGRNERRDERGPH